MEEAQFDQLLQFQTAQQLSSLLKTQPEPASADLTYLTPKNAVKLERTMNRVIVGVGESRMYAHIHTV